MPETARIPHDPRSETRPNYDHSRWDGALGAHISAHGGTREEAIQHFISLWQEDLDERTAAWDAQVAADDAAARAQEEARLQQEFEARERQEAADEADRLAAEKKRPQAPEMDDDLLAPEYSEVSPSAYARKKLRDYEFVELYYFHPDKCSEAASSAKDSDKTFSVVDNGDGQLSFTPSSRKTSKDIKEDKQLTWHEFSLAAPIFMRTLVEVGWKPHLTSGFQKFFYALGIHPIRNQPHGDLVVILYAAETRAEWHRLHSERRKVFNIGEISEERMRRIDYAVVRNLLVRKADAVPMQLVRLLQHVLRSC